MWFKHWFARKPRQWHTITVRTHGGMAKDAAVSLDGRYLSGVRYLDVHLGIDRVSVVRIELIADVDLEVDNIEVERS